MDELSMLRAVRPQDGYADERREAARDRLLAEATASESAGRRPLRSTRAMRISRPWQAGLAAALAIGVTAAVAGTYRAGGGTPTHGAPARGGEATASGAASVLLLAADAAQQSAPPPGARWVVWQNQMASTATAHKQCSGIAMRVTAQADARLRSLASCQAEPPASLPELRHARPVSTRLPGLGPLPDQPAALLRSAERWYAADYKQNADSLPDHPAPPLTRPGLYAGAFDVLRTLLDGGVTSPSPAVQLRALALIPGTKVATGARDAAGQPGIAVTITSPDAAQTGFSQEEIIFDSHTYQNVGGVLVQPDQYATSGSVTLSTTRTWQAYYDAAGHKL